MQSPLRALASSLSVVFIAVACGRVVDVHWIPGATDGGGPHADAASGGAAADADGAAGNAVGGSNAHASTGGTSNGSSGRGGATSNGGGGSPVGGGGASGGARFDSGANGDSGMSGAASDSGSTGGASSGGFAGWGGGTDAGGACLEDRDCPRPPTHCAVARCDHGTCIAVNAKVSAVIPDVPGDCHDQICDGLGGIADRVLDENDVPAFENPCVVGTCDKAGIPGTAFQPTGTPCAQGGGGILCDGDGECVQCLVQSDCPAGLHCQKDRYCGTTPCTDVDCGGGCKPCGLGGKCEKNFDCLSAACDFGTHTCITDPCADHQMDNSETGVDCGGTNRCPRCPLGGACTQELDCTPNFCDLRLHQCVTNQCTDHALDGDETDNDCGGATCAARCGMGKLCKSNTDCQAGLACGGSPQLCD